MTLCELKSMFFSRPTIPYSPTIYVFGDENSADNWILHKYFGKDTTAFDQLFTLQSDYRADYFLQEKWWKCNVQHFYAVEPDVIVAVIEEFD